MPRARREFVVNFYGGEPLLAFGLIRETVERARFLARKSGRRPRFALTTNGSLLSDEILAFLAANRFSLVLSYDGAAQDTERSPGSGSFLRGRIRRIVKDDRLRLEVNAVFSPGTVSTLAATVLDLTALDVPRIRYSLTSLEPWSAQARRRLKSELEQVSTWAAGRRRRGKSAPLVNHQEELSGRIRSCPAGKDRLAVDVEGKIWGCALFSDYARKAIDPGFRKKFGFGSIGLPAAGTETWEGRYQRNYPNYARLAEDLRAPSGPCFLCPVRIFCLTCPINAALSGGRIGLIPENMCRLQKVKIAALP